MTAFASVSTSIEMFGTSFSLTNSHSTEYKVICHKKIRCTHWYAISSAKETIKASEGKAIAFKGGSSFKIAFLPSEKMFIVKEIISFRKGLDVPENNMVEANRRL